MEKPNIYQFDDFREYLRLCFLAKQQSQPKYSHRKFAAEAGFTNPGYLNDVIKGHRKLSKTALEKIIRVFNIHPSEEDFFRLIVEYGQCKKLKTKDELYQKILFRRSRSSFTRLNPELVKYYQDYRYPLIRSAIEVKAFKGDYDAL